MSRQNIHQHHLDQRKCKIRKRGCSSSSSSSLIRKRYRFKRAILMRKRGGSSTPVPNWGSNLKSPCPELMADRSRDLTNQRQPLSSSKEVSVSARKLAATLWEINHVPSVKKDLEITKDPKRVKNRNKLIKQPSQSSSLLLHLSDPSYTPFLEKRDLLGGGHQTHHRRMSTVTQKLQLTDYYLGGFGSRSNAYLMEAEDPSRGKSHRKCTNDVKTRLKEISNRLTTSKELVKVLNHVWGVEEQHYTGMSLVSSLRAELDRACTVVKQLIGEQRSNRNEMDHLMKHYAEEKAYWKRKEQERIRSALSCIAKELEVEKKLRRQTERMNKKLGKELVDSKAALSKAMKELEREKRAKEILEQVCDELARGIGEDRTQVEELKRESAKVREEVEKEREMLQLADVLREERVQMKLSEARYHFEEKNAAVEQLRNELEDYMKSKLGEEEDGSPKFERIKELEAYLKKINFGSSQNIEKEYGGQLLLREEEEEEEEENDEDDSAESDLHSIELNMDNDNKSYKWSFALGDDYDDDDSKRISVDKEFRGRRSISEKIQWGSICLNRSSNGIIEMEFGPKIQNYSNGFLAERSEVDAADQSQEDENEIKSCRSVMGLTDKKTI